MCTGGRIKHHLVQNISRPESTILFVGYQAEGTLGRQILEGQPEVRIFGERHPLQARVEQIQNFSAHADRDALLEWLDVFRVPLPKIFLTHGEKAVAQSLANLLLTQKSWNVSLPAYKDVWEWDF